MDDDYDFVGFAGLIERFFSSTSLAMSLSTRLFNSASRVGTRGLASNGGAGFNAFRQWPSDSGVKLTKRAQGFFFSSPDKQEKEVSFERLMAISKARNKMEAAQLEKMKSFWPQADQRGEKVLLDVDPQGRPGWVKEAGRPAHHA